MAALRSPCELRMKLKLVLKIVAMSWRCVICRMSLKMSSAVAISLSGVAPVLRIRTAGSRVSVISLATGLRDGCVLTSL